MYFITNLQTNLLRIVFLHLILSYAENTKWQIINSIIPIKEICQLATLIDM